MNCNGKNLASTGMCFVFSGVESLAVIMPALSKSDLHSLAQLSLSMKVLLDYPFFRYRHL